MHRQSSNQGFTLVEAMVISLLFAVILGAGVMVFVSGQNAFSLTSVRADLQENARRTLQRVSSELQESGRDNNGVLKVTILDGLGVNGTDILRFSIPICVCGTSSIDSNGNVKNWGAPLVWGKPGCSTNYPLNNGKVDICHYPTGNPNPQNMSGTTDAVKGHLAHGDYIGMCASCSPNAYTNRTVEYSINAGGQLLRRVLDTNNAVVNSVIFAERLTDFQASLNVAQTVVTVTVQLSEKASQNRTILNSSSMDVVLRNRG